MSGEPVSTEESDYLRLNPVQSNDEETCNWENDKHCSDNQTVTVYYRSMYMYIYRMYIIPHLVGKWSTKDFLWIGRNPNGDNVFFNFATHIKCWFVTKKTVYLENTLAPSYVGHPNKIRTEYSYSVYSNLTLIEVNWVSLKDSLIQYPQSLFPGICGTAIVWRNHFLELCTIVSHTQKVLSAEGPRQPVSFPSYK